VIDEKRLGRDHLDTLRTVGNLGVNYKDAGRLQEAIPLLEEANRAAKKYPELGIFGNALFDAYVTAGKTAEAAKLIDDARTRLPKDSPELAGQLSMSALSLLEAKAFTEAEPLLRECLTIREKTQPDVWSTFNAQSMLGGALLGQKKFADAEPLLLKGYEGMKQREKLIPAQADTRLPEALDRLIELYTATNKPDEAKRWQAERAKSPDAKPAQRK
jgi:predicted Zn-dependent protease